MSEKGPGSEKQRLTQEQYDRLVAIVMDLARTGRTAELADFLDSGLPLETPDADGNTVLMLAAYHGQQETVSELIGRGADVDALNARGQSPLAGALFKGEDDIVAALVAAGADLDLGTPTARQTAQMFGRAHLLGEA